MRFRKLKQKINEAWVMKSSTENKTNKRQVESRLNVPPDKISIEPNREKSSSLFQSFYLYDPMYDYYVLH